LDQERTTVTFRNLLKRFEQFLSHLKVDSVAGRVIERHGSYLFVEFKVNELHAFPSIPSERGLGDD
jgi:hypothetical protein